LGLIIILTVLLVVWPLSGNMPVFMSERKVNVEKHIFASKI
jgi:hypothetical protein